MAVYNITSNARAQLQTKLEDAKTLLSGRKTLWNSLSPEKKAQWKVSCPDPVIDLMYKVYLWLKDFFGE